MSASSAEVLLLTEKLPIILAAVSSARYASMAAATLIVYDHVTTLDQEASRVELIWDAPWTNGKALFIASRYYGIFALLFNNYAMNAFEMTETLCVHTVKFLEDIPADETQYSASKLLTLTGRFWILWQGFTGVFISASLAELVLVLRVRALYRGNRAITWILGAGFVLAMLGSATIVGTALEQSPLLLIDLPTRTICRMQSFPSYLPAYFAPVVLFETLLGVLAALRWVREVGLRLRSPEFVPAMLRVLVRDSALYFVIMTLTYCASAIVWIAAPDYLEVTLAFLLAMSCVLVNRLILNVRARHEKQSRVPSSPDSLMQHLDIELQFPSPSRRHEGDA
ncbi:hypothetical protein FA95DRAFT_1679393 [Auriscalpium vulgare]|uniref:Uncharacterized protein n=1 Tax=Auriscalpium vulgare TaxID=40419 RepID=A0ACB8RTY3_9AGAM|nr:hypothetical protein FA95DRAFT_1679393 [Auriscalpium vulgare]